MDPTKLNKPKQNTNCACDHRHCTVCHDTKLDERLMKRETCAQCAWQLDVKRTRRTRERHTRWNVDTSKQQPHLSSTRSVMKSSGSPQGHLAVAPAVCANSQETVVGETPTSSMLTSSASSLTYFCHGPRSSCASERHT